MTINIQIDLEGWAKWTDGSEIHLPPRGHKMPMTTEQFHHMGDLYEKALLEQKAINSELRSKVSDLTNKLNNRNQR